MEGSSIIDAAKRIANETAQLAEQVEAQGQDATRPAPTAYSSSVSSTEVDPVSGEVKVTLILYPGDAPINPIPEEEPAPEVPGSTVPPVEGASTSVTPAETPAETVPPGQQPAAE